jgi:hypothetical protein
MSEQVKDLENNTCSLISKQSEVAATGAVTAAPESPPEAAGGVQAFWLLVWMTK